MGGLHCWLYITLLNTHYLHSWGWKTSSSCASIFCYQKVYFPSVTFCAFAKKRSWIFVLDHLACTREWQTQAVHPGWHGAKVAGLGREWGLGVPALPKFLAFPLFTPNSWMLWIKYLLSTVVQNPGIALLETLMQTRFLKSGCLWHDRGKK